MKTLEHSLRSLALAVGLLAIATIAASGAERQESSEKLRMLLGLSDAQAAAIDQEAAGLEKALQPHVLRMAEIQGQTERAIQSGDATAIGRAVLERMDVVRRINAEKKASQERIQAILTPQQVEKLSQMIEALRFAKADTSFLGPLGPEAAGLREARERPERESRGTQARRPNTEGRATGVPGGGRPPR